MQTLLLPWVHTMKKLRTQILLLLHIYIPFLLMCLVQSCLFSDTPVGILIRTVTTMVHFKSPFTDLCILLITSESYFTKFAQFFVFYFPTKPSSHLSQNRNARESKYTFSFRQENHYFSHYFILETLPKIKTAKTVT